MELTPHQQLLKDFVNNLNEHWEDIIQPEILSPEGKYYDFTSLDVVDCLVNFCICTMAQQENREDLFKGFYNIFYERGFEVLREIRKAIQEDRDPFAEYE